MVKKIGQTVFFVVQNENEDMKMQADFDMNNKRIKNLSNPINDGDAINKLYCDNISYYSGNHTCRNIFSELTDLVETSRFHLIQGVTNNE